MQHLQTDQTGLRARAGSGPLPQAFVTPSLDEFETLILWGMRQWMRAHKERRCATRSVLDAFEFSGLVAALAPLNRMMTLLVLGSRRRLAIATTATAPLSIDEQLLLRILNAARQRQTDLVESRLGLWMEQVSIRATAYSAMRLAEAVFAPAERPARGASLETKKDTPPLRRDVLFSVQIQQADLRQSITFASDCSSR